MSDFDFSTLGRVSLRAAAEVIEFAHAMAGRGTGYRHQGSEAGR
jgi:hypothetical protein